MNARGIHIESYASLSGVRLLFFGVGGVFSRLPLEALLRAGADLRAVVTPAQPGATLADSAQAPFTRLEPSPRRAAQRRAAERPRDAGGAGGVRARRHLCRLLH